MTTQRRRLRLLAAPAEPAADRTTKPAAVADDAWQPLVPQTLVDRVIEQIVSLAANGAILPGDRLVEHELARRLGVSRVPIREALRVLESRGVTIKEPYRGMRLVPVTNDWVMALTEARAALETAAAHRAVTLGRHRRPQSRALEEAIAEMDEAARRHDASALASADTAFHRALCQLGGNPVILDLWETLALRTTIAFGLATEGRAMDSIVAEHRELLDCLFTGDRARIAEALAHHITHMNRLIDFEAIIAMRRRQRQDASGDHARAKAARP